MHFVSETAQFKLEKWTSVSPWYTAWNKDQDGLGEFCGEYWDNEKLRAGMLAGAYTRPLLSPT